MRFNLLVILLLFTLIFGCTNQVGEKPKIEKKPEVKSKPSVSFTFDDGHTGDIAHYKFEEWNEMILSHLENEELTAVFFVTGNNKLDKKGQFLLKSWNDKGHKLCQPHL